jgi:hypothetical protein
MPSLRSLRASAFSVSPSAAMIEDPMQALRPFQLHKVAGECDIGGQSTLVVDVEMVTPCG